MPSWWEELVEVPGQEDYQQFARMVHASFEVPKVHNWVKRGNNDHTPLLSHPSIGKYQFLPLWYEHFSAQDYQLAQSQNMVAYVKALQH